MAESMKYVIGIDPGLTGALALFKDGELVEVEDMPVVSRGGIVKNKVAAVMLKGIMRRWCDIYNGVTKDTVVVGIERVSSLGKQGVAGMFSFGHSCGVVEGVFGEFEMTFPTPAAWKKQFGLLRQDKDVARTKAIEMYPNWAEKLKRKKDIGRADAILIGRYCSENSST
jgi:crossover junction endodeoxyribonuclease RuvC